MPASRQATRSPASTLAVMAMMGTSGESRPRERMFCVVSIPFAPGRFQSIKTRSTLSCWRKSRARSPLSTATAPRPRSSSCLSASVRLISESSTTSTVPEAVPVASMRSTVLLSAGAHGMVKTKVLPTPTVLSTAIVAFMASARRRTMANPRPVPCTPDFPTRTNGSKIESMSAGSMPTPLSRTCTDRFASSEAKVTCTDPIWV